MKNKFTEKQDIFLKDNVKNITLKELTEKFNIKFNCNKSQNAIACRKHKIGIKSGIVGSRFAKGNISWNKGTKGIMKANKTSFKKGNIPHNWRPVGSERITKDGYIEIKIQEPNKWKTKHRYIYEQEYGIIPKGYKIIFADGNKSNFDFNNLMLVSDNEEFIMNRHNLRTDDIDITKSGYCIAKLIQKQTEVIKNVK